MTERCGRCANVSGLCAQVGCGGFVEKAPQDTMVEIANAPQHTKAKIPQNIIERLEAVQCIVASPCDADEAYAAWDELDSIIAELRLL